MFKVNEETGTINMNEGDYGLILTFTLDEVLEDTKFKFKIYKGNSELDKEILLEKDIEATGKDVNLSLTKEETIKIKKGEYYWSFLQYKEEELHNTITVDYKFYVEEGA